jgi:putative methylase
VDPDALAIAKENIESLEMEEEITLLNARIGHSIDVPSEGKSHEKSVTRDSADSGSLALFSPDELTRRIDTCVTNPPFGTWNKGIDMVFLEEACKVSRQPGSRSHMHHQGKIADATCDS